VICAIFLCLVVLSKASSKGAFLEVAKELFHRLEMARDRRMLDVHEEFLRQKLKLKSLGLSSLQRTIERHESRLLWLKEGDASTNFSLPCKRSTMKEAHSHP
jgi:hypothetical protein